MKKLSLLLASVLLLNLLAGCGAQTTDNEPSFDEICKTLESDLDKWAAESFPDEVDHLTYEFAKDDLLMNITKNERTYSNTSLVVGVYYNAANINGVAQEMSVADAVFEQIHNAFVGSSYSVVLKMLEVVGHTQSGLSRSAGVLDWGTTSNFFAEIPAEEMKIQTIAYDFVENINRTDYSPVKIKTPDEVILERFGVKPETKELYIEIHSYSSPAYTGDYKKDVEAFVNSLDDRSLDLYNQIVSSKDAVKYLKDSDVTKITIFFNNTWGGEDNDFTHSYDL